LTIRGNNASAIVELPSGSSTLNTIGTLTFNAGYYPYGDVE